MIRGNQEIGEIVHLWSAVIRNAIVEYRKETESFSNPHQRSYFGKYRRDAKFWLFHDSRTGPGSLFWICQHLGLDISVVREKANTCSVQAIGEYQRKEGWF